MAKKNSSKTATEKSLSASEPRVQVFKGWQGINIKDAPLGWEPRETGHHDHNQVDLRPNYLVLQNNLTTDMSLSVQTRPDPVIVATHPDGGRFTGVSAMYDRWLFAAVRFPDASGFIDKVYWKDITSGDWNILSLCDNTVRKINQSGTYSFDWTIERVDNPPNYEITEIGFYEGNIIVMTKHHIDDSGAGPASYQKFFGEMFIAKLIHNRKITATEADGVHQTSDNISFEDRYGVANKLTSPIPTKNPMESYPFPGEPYSSRMFQILAVGQYGLADTGDGSLPPSSPTDNCKIRIELCVTYVNEFGATLPSDIRTCYVKYDPVTWSTSRYLFIYGHCWAPGATGVDIWVSVGENQTKAFIGHVDFDVPVDPDDPERFNIEKYWSFDWYGALIDTASWGNSMLELPEENTTKGPNACHFSAHDSRLYFWGNPSVPYRLFIGGNPGNELSVARGYGGGFIDIEPGTGIEIKGTAKWKTVSGANIVTMMCGNPNTGLVKRFNLIETNIVTTNELSSKSWMYEEVSNVVGCNSRWGYGVFSDGLYSMSRYGLMLTTMAMEYNSQMRNTKVSEVIDPVFTDKIGKRLKDCRIVCIDEIIYIALSDEDDDDLDQVILCYDINLKSWYTFTIGTSITKPIHHIMSIDSDEYHEGLGVVTDDNIILYPLAGYIQDPDPQDFSKPEFNVILETGELAVRQPVQSFQWVHQIELRFDYFFGSCNVFVEGVDYYGRPFKITKILNREEKISVMRSYTEYIHVGMLVETYRIRIEGPARFRLSSINAKVYTQSNRIGTPYGFDDHSEYMNRHGGANDDHHYINDYNNLRRAIVT